MQLESSSGERSRKTYKIGQSLKSVVVNLLVSVGPCRNQFLNQGGANALVIESIEDPNSARVRHRIRLDHVSESERLNKGKQAHTSEVEYDSLIYQ